MTHPRPDRRELLMGGVTGIAAAVLGPRLITNPDKEASMAQHNKEPHLSPPAEYVARDYTGLLGTPGFSETMLKNHFTLYQGYVKNTNTVLAALTDLGKENKLGTPAAAEMRRRFGWEFNGMRLHELYFENMGGKTPLKPEGKVAQALVKHFGSVDAWTADFKAVGTMRGIGWTALVHDGWTGRLFNTWINEHDVGALAACPVLLIMDVFEHAFITDYQLKRADYIEAFFKAINWETVEKRL